MVELGISDCLIRFQIRLLYCFWMFSGICMIIPFSGETKISFILEIPLWKIVNRRGASVLLHNPFSGVDAAGCRADPNGWLVGRCLKTISSFGLGFNVSIYVLCSIVYMLSCNLEFIRIGSLCVSGSGLLRVSLVPAISGL